MANDSAKLLEDVFNLALTGLLNKAMSVCKSKDKRTITRSEIISGIDLYLPPEIAELAIDNINKKIRVYSEITERKKAEKALKQPEKKKQDKE
jgi:hypothetical protein